MEASSPILENEINQIPNVSKNMSNSQSVTNDDTNKDSRKKKQLINGNVIKKDGKKIKVNDEKTEQSIAIAIKIPSELAQEKTDIIIELERNKEIINHQQSNENLHRSTYFPCIEEKFDRAVFAGTIKVPPSVDLEKITSMPLFIFDSAQDIPKTMQSDFKYLSKIKPVKKSLSDSVNGKMLFGEINLKIIFQNKQSMFKKSFAKKSVKDNSLECSFIINTPERNQNVNDMNMASCSSQGTSKNEHELKLLHSKSITSIASKDNVMEFHQTNSETKSIIDSGNSSGINEETKSITCSPSESEEMYWPEKDHTPTGSVVSLASVNSLNLDNHRVPSNSPTNKTSLYSNKLSEFTSEGENNLNNETDRINKSKSNIYEEVDTNVEFGGVKKNHSNITNGQNSNCTLKNTKNITNVTDINVIDSKTGVQTIQNLYSTSLTAIDNNLQEEKNKSKINHSYEDLLSKRYLSSAFKEDATVLTYAIVENDVKNMIKDLLNESDKIKTDVTNTVDIENDGNSRKIQETQKLKSIKDALNDILCCTVPADNVDKSVTSEEDVKYVIEKILENVNNCEIQKKLINIENSVQNIGDASKVTNNKKDVCKSHPSIYYCHTNVLENLRMPTTSINDKKMFPATVSVRKLSPSKKSILRNDENLIKILEKSNGLLTNLYNELCSYETITYELDSTSSEHLYETNPNNRYHRYNGILRNLSAHSTTTFTNNDKSTSIENVKAFDSDTNPSTKNTNGTKTPNAFPKVTSMQKSSKFLDIRKSGSTPKAKVIPTSERDTDSVLEEKLIKNTDLTQATSNIDKEEPSTSKSKDDKLSPRRSLQKLKFQSITNETTEDEIEMNTTNLNFTCKISDYCNIIKEKPSIYSRASTRTRASNYVESVSSSSFSSSDDSLLIKRTPKMKTKKKDTKLQKVYSNKSLKSSESDGFVEFPSLKLSDSNTNLELEIKNGHPNIGAVGHYTELPRKKLIKDTSTIDSANPSDEDYQADREDTLLSLPKLKYVCASVQELNTESEIRIIEENVKANLILEEFKDANEDDDTEMCVIFSKSTIESESILSSEPSK